MIEGVFYVKMTEELYIQRIKELEKIVDHIDERFSWLLTHISEGDLEQYLEQFPEE